MQKRYRITVLTLTLLLTGCHMLQGNDPQQPLPKNQICDQIKNDIVFHDRYPQTPTGYTAAQKSRLLNNYQKYDCENKA